ncbi:hypothetical protein M9Y10_036806 [Tritrichomonas musculus]|uniref:mitogen-activated protein kinase kinase n=1 Tax=Tritrichomonas musculus TaxID=1915356 RepID=A0ABR2GTU6_9EUKA
MQSLEICGNNIYCCLNESINFLDRVQVVYPPAKSSFNVSTIISYSLGNHNTIVVTNDGNAYGIGLNNEGVISNSFPKPYAEQFTKIELRDINNRPCSVISAVSSSIHTFYMIADKNDSNHKMLAYASLYVKTQFPIILDIGDRVPIALFSGVSCAAIDEEGAILYIDNSTCDFANKKIEPTFLPNFEAATSVAWCNNFIYALGSTGKLFWALENKTLSFSEVPELKGKEVICISGTFRHCIAVTKDEHVFVYGINTNGELGLGQNIKKVYEFTEVLSLRDKKIISAYAGTVHSIFQSSDGKIFTCGSNYNGALLIDIKAPTQYEPIETAITGVSFCITGTFTSAYFKNYIPENIPNRRVDVSKLIRRHEDVGSLETKSDKSDNEEIKMLKEEYEVRIAKQQEEYEEIINIQKEQQEELIKKQQEEYEKRIKDIQDLYEDKIKRQQEEYEKQIKESQDLYEDKIKRQQEEYEEIIKNQKNSYEEQIKTLTKEFECKIANKNKEIQSLELHHVQETGDRKEKTEDNTSHMLQMLKNRIKILDSETILNLEKLEKINSGNFGKVYKVTKKEIYALKVMKVNATHEDFKQFLAEYEIINILLHPNIVKAYGIFLGDETNSPSILLEFCPLSLEEAIIEKKLTNVDLVFSIYQIAEGMKYVHFNHVIHRDLKPTNILITKEGTIKISDFGISKLMSPDDQSMTCGIGTQKFMAPEIIDECSNYDEKVDVYSFGVLLYFILSGGEMPKVKLSDKLSGKKASIPSSFSVFSRQLIDRCWNFEAKDRPNFDEIINEIERNNYNLVDLSESELYEVKSLIKHHKDKIPSY